MIISRRLLFLIVIMLMLVLTVFMARQSLSAKKGTFYLTEAWLEKRATGEEIEQIRAYPVSGIKYSTGLRHSETNEQGEYKYRAGKNILFKIGDFEIGLTPGEPETTQASFSQVNSKNLAALLLALDEDGYRQNGIQITPDSIPAEKLDIDLSLPSEEFSKLLAQKLSQEGRLSFVAHNGDKLPVSGLGYVSGIELGKTGSNGEFGYQLNKQVTFRINENDIQTLRGANHITLEQFEEPVQSNLHQYLISVDEDSDSSNGIELAGVAESFTIDFNQPREKFETSLGKALNRIGREAKLIFIPSLGINIEAPQAEADTVGQPMPFADIFRTARPFREFSEDGVDYDADGWPINIPQGKKVYTLILQSLPEGAIPYGQYTVLYDGVGTLAYDGLAKRVDFSTNKDIIDIRPQNSTVNRLILRVTETSPEDPVRNIRIIMPGGICEDVPYIRVDNSEDCPFGKYRAFEDMLQDRNTIVFNPDYLRLLRNFRVLRMMNMMEASLHIPRSCYSFKDADFRNCIMQPLNWDQRAKMSDAVWGGSHRTDATLKHGVPVEVLVKLANTVKASPWFTIPHNASDEYNEEFAEYVAENLDSGLNAWVEYSNETWNGRFWAAHYVRNKGRLLELDRDKNPFREGFRFYTMRMVEIFQIWEQAFEDSNRLIRVAGSYQNSTDLSRNILEYENAHQHIDALAIAPYFHACNSRNHRDCKNPITVPRLLPEVDTVDHIFEALQNPSDPYGAPATFKLIKRQAELADKYDVDLVAYEGGQHLAVDWSDKERTKTEKEELKDLFAKANADPRMGELYQQLLHNWRNANGTLFNLFNIPQTWHRWGSWGLKTHLNQPRKESVKYDAAMVFQEETGVCWWDACLQPQ